MMRQLEEVNWNVINSNEKISDSLSKSMYPLFEKCFPRIKVKLSSNRIHEMVGKHRVEEPNFILHSVQKIDPNDINVQKINTDCNYKLPDLCEYIPTVSEINCKRLLFVRMMLCSWLVKNPKNSHGFIHLRR